MHCQPRACQRDSAERADLQLDAGSTISALSDSHALHQLEQLTADQVSASFSHLCSAILRPRFAEIGTTWQAWGARDIHNKPCGLVLAKRISSETETMLSVVSLVVTPRERRKGLASRLLERLRCTATENGIRRLHLAIPLERPSTAALRKLTPYRDGWARSPGKVVVTLSDRRRVEPLLIRLEQSVSRMRGRSRWHIEPYPRKLTPELQQRLQRSESEPIGAPWDPADNSYSWEPEHRFSRLLRCDHGQIIGWLITHSAGVDLLRYGKLWIDPGWERTGAPLALLCEVMRTAHFQNRPCIGDPEVCWPVRRGCFISHPNNERLHNLVLRKFKPVCDSWVEVENCLLQL